MEGPDDNYQNRFYHLLSWNALSFFSSQSHTGLRSCFSSYSPHPESKSRLFSTPLPAYSMLIFDNEFYFTLNPLPSNHNVLGSAGSDCQHVLHLYDYVTCLIPISFWKQFQGKEMKLKKSKRCE